MKPPYNNDSPYEEFNSKTYELLGMRHDTRHPFLFLLTRMSEESSSRTALFRFEMKGHKMQVDSVLPMYGASPEDDFSGELPDDAPQELLTFGEVLDFVGEVLVPTDGEEIGEAELRYVMDRYSLSRGEAANYILDIRESAQDQRECPDFGPMQLILLRCRDKGCTISLHSNEKGEWRFELHTPHPGDRLVTETQLFSLSALDVLYHLNKLPRSNKEQA
jgi:hypothetical protein